MDFFLPLLDVVIVPPVSAEWWVASTDGSERRLLNRLVLHENLSARRRYRGRSVEREPAVIARLISISDQMAMGTVA